MKELAPYVIAAIVLGVVVASAPLIAFNLSALVERGIFEDRLAPRALTDIPPPPPEPVPPRAEASVRRLIAEEAATQVLDVLRSITLLMTIPLAVSLAIFLYVKAKVRW